MCTLHMDSGPHFLPSFPWCPEEVSGNHALHPLDHLVLLSGYKGAVTPSVNLPFQQILHFSTLYYHKLLISVIITTLLISVALAVSIPSANCLISMCILRHLSFHIRTTAKVQTPVMTALPCGWTLGIFWHQGPQSPCNIFFFGLLLKHLLVRHS